MLKEQTHTLRTTLMHRYSLLHAFWMSFFSRDFYRDVGRQWKGIGFVYLMLLLAILWVPTTLKFHNSAHDFLTYKLPPVVAEIPTLTMKDGQLSIDTPMPYKIKENNQSTRFALVVDTTGQYKTLDQAKTDILIMKTKAIARDRDTGEVKELVYKEVEPLQNLHLTSQMMLDFLDEHQDTYLLMACFAIYGLGLVASLIYRLVQVVVFALVAGAFCRNREKYPLSFADLCRVVSIAITPAVILGTIAGVLSLDVPLLVYLVISIVYITFGIKACKEAPLKTDADVVE
jgi:hypothetical protein